MSDFSHPADAQNGADEERAVALQPDETPDPGNREGFSRLVERHHRDLLVFAKALTRHPQAASEIVQDAFVTAWDKLATFDVTRDFGAWMRGIVRNKWREWLRKNRSHHTELSEEQLALLDGTVAEWQQVKAKEHNPTFTALELCLDRLPEPLREAVDAYYYKHDHGDEAAAELGASPAALRKRLQRARALLRECLDRKLDAHNADS